MRAPGAIPATHLVWTIVTGPVRARGTGVVPVLLTALLVVLVLAVGAAAGLLGGRGLRQAQDPLPPLGVPTGRATPAAVAAATAAPSALPSSGGGTAPTAAAVQAALAGPLADPRLGGRTSGQVVVLGSGAVLASFAPDLGVAPASTAKIATAAAALTALGAAARVTTTVVAGPTPGAVTLVGAGDPTLSAAAVGAPTTYAGAARVSDLAAAVTATLADTPVTAVYVDGAAFSGPTTAPGWAPEDAPSEYGAPVTAAMVDGARDTPDATVRSGTPDIAAGQALAAALGVPDVPVAATTTAPSTDVLGSVQSAPVAVLVQEMLKESDNVLAEVLARLVAMGTGQPASFEGAAAAVRAVLPEAGTGLVDGSGLSVLDRVTAADLTAVLGRVAGAENLRPIALMLPVAGWDGTLRDRFLTAPDSAGAGRVRAKTGTLTGVSCLAGLVVTSSGRLLAFAVLADQVPATYGGTLDAEAALDRVAAALASLA